MTFIVTFLIILLVAIFALAFLKMVAWMIKKNIQNIRKKEFWIPFSVICFITCLILYPIATLIISCAIISALAFARARYLIKHPKKTTVEKSTQDLVHDIDLAYQPKQPKSGISNKTLLACYMSSTN